MAVCACSAGVDMTKNELMVSNVGGVWNINPNWPSIIDTGYGIDHAIKYLELIADDFTFTFRTSQQKWPNSCIDLDGTINLHKPYGPKSRK
jgi:hypothetical protein